MIIGDTRCFAIECHHDPIPNETKRVFGRMCIHTASGMLGDVTEPSCMLNVTEGVLERVLSNLPMLNDEKIAALADSDAFKFLDEVLYLETERSAEELWDAHQRYFKYDFLSQGGESFEKSKSFITLAGNNVRILFSDTAGSFHVACVAPGDFRNVIDAFFVWLKKEGEHVPKI